MSHRPEVSFVLPCLDEEETLGACIRQIQASVVRHGLDAEVVVADNGSRDASVEIALREGARVVEVRERGYGAALMEGFAAARGRYLVMGDADLSYDFDEAWPMVEALRGGADLVMGSRFRGRIEAGAMPWSHRWIGNPILSWLGRALFATRVSDFHCGLRALTREAFDTLALRTTGMEFATEMVVKAAARGLRIEEVPVTLRPDGRSRMPHLRTWRDGWRHLRFLLTLSPRWTLFVPGLVLFSMGVLMLAALSLGPLQLGRVTLNVHTLLAGSLLTLVGYQTMTTALFARLYAMEEDLGPPAGWIRSASRVVTLERGLLVGTLLVVAGFVPVALLFREWARAEFGPLDPAVTLRPMVIGATLIPLGAQTIFMSFVYSMLGIERRRR